MRYMILETDWSTVALSRVLAEQNNLLTRTERPEELLDYLKALEVDALAVHGQALRQTGLSLPDLRAAAPDAALAVLENGSCGEIRAGLLNKGADIAVDDRVCPHELSARLQAAARRRRGLASPHLDIGDLRIDLGKRRASVSGVALCLSPKVYEMLERMALRPGKLITRDALLNHIYALENEPDSRIFDVYICTLRERLDACGTDVEIETVRGQGFRLVHAPRSGDARAA